MILLCFRIFKRIDQNKDNKIDFQEFQGALHHEGIFVETDVEHECFNAIDQDGTGFLNFDEFLVALRVTFIPVFLLNLNNYM